MEKPKTIYEMVEEVENSFVKIKNFYFKNLIKTSYGIYIVMDKKFNWYLGIINKINAKHDLLYDHYTDPNREYYKFRLYDISKEMISESKKTFIGRFDFSLNTEIYAEPNDIRLEYIYIEKNYGRISLGSNLINVLELISLNLNIFKIQGTFSPFGYANKNGVTNFYEQNGFEIKKQTRIENYKIFQSRIIEKKLTTNVVCSLKKKVINFPTKNKTFTAIISDEILVGSNYKDSEF